MILAKFTVSPPTTGWLVLLTLIAVVACVLATARVAAPKRCAWLPLGVLALVIAYFWQALAVASHR